MLGKVGFFHQAGQLFPSDGSTAAALSISLRNPSERERAGGIFNAAGRLFPARE